VRIVYLEVPYAVLLQRNRARNAPLPEAALGRLARSLDVLYFAWTPCRMGHSVRTRVLSGSG
jgi:hypothetical protein